MARKPKWRPRASQLGYYMQCSYRAAFDRALYEGILDIPEALAAEVEAKKQSSPYADLGTCIHYHLQAGMGCIFEGKTSDHAPTTEQELNASALFGSDVEKTRLAVRNSAILATQHMPKLPDGMQWQAEVSIRTKHYTGHIDFVCPEAGIIADLKTTSKPPLHPYIKPAHLVQLLAYTAAIEVATGKPIHTGVVLYVDSTSASWAMPITADLTSPGMLEYKQHVIDAAAGLCSKSLYKIAHPQIGDVCDEWCPYTSLCRDQYRSAKGASVRAAGPRLKGFA